MFIERPPRIFRLFFPGCIFRKQQEKKCVYLTFDDGPVPGITTQVLDILDRHGIKATFFMVGDNVRKHPAEYQDVVNRGHAVGNHTMHHLQGIRTTTRKYIADVMEARKYIGETSLFRPPHGVLRARQAMSMKKHFRIVMYDLVTRDYSKHLSVKDIVDNVRKYTRNGSVIVFHDSEKSAPRVIQALEESLIWLENQGYEFRLIDSELNGR